MIAFPRIVGVIELDIAVFFLFFSSPGSRYGPGLYFDLNECMTTHHTLGQGTPHFFFWFNQAGSIIMA